VRLIADGFVSSSHDTGSMRLRRPFIDKLVVAPDLKLPELSRLYRMREDLCFQIAAADHIVFKDDAAIAPSKADFIFQHVFVQSVLRRAR
jgi:hypothetical protein